MNKDDAFVCIFIESTSLFKVEWMSDKIMRMFEDQRSNPFQFKYAHKYIHCIIKLHVMFV